MLTALARAARFGGDGALRNFGLVRPQGPSLRSLILHPALGSSTAGDGCGPGYGLLGGSLFYLLIKNYFTY